MNGHFLTKNLGHRLIHCLMGALVINAATIAGDIYLAATGPTPMRFRLEVPRLDPGKVLPPLQMADPETLGTSTNAEPTVQIQPEAPTGGAEKEASSEIQEQDHSPVVQQLEAVTNPESAPKQSDLNGISPQMLLRYFNRGGTQEVIVPYSVDFTPPVPVRSGASSAQYISE